MFLLMYCRHMVITHIHTHTVTATNTHWLQLQQPPTLQHIYLPTIFFLDWSYLCTISKPGFYILLSTVKHFYFYGYQLCDHDHGPIHNTEVPFHMLCFIEYLTPNSKDSTHLSQSVFIHDTYSYWMETVFLFLVTVTHFPETQSQITFLHDLAILRFTYDL